MICKWHGFILPVVFVTQQSDLKTFLSVLSKCTLFSLTAVQCLLGLLVYHLLNHFYMMDIYLGGSQCGEEYHCTCLLEKHVDLISLITHLKKTILIWSKAGILRCLALPSTIVLNLAIGHKCIVQ